MSLFKSLESVKNYKQRLRSVDEERNANGDTSQLSGSVASECALPNYVLAFIQELAIATSPFNHLDPSASIYSPSMILELGETTVFCTDEAQANFTESISSDRSLNVVIGDGILLLENTTDKFDLITSFPPFGCKLDAKQRQLLATPFPGPHDRSSLIIYKALKLLSVDGTAFFIVPNGLFLHGNIEPVLESNGFYINAIFSLAPGALSQTHIPANLIVIKRTSSKFTFYAELSDDMKTLQQIIDSYQVGKVEGDLSEIPRGSYKGAVAVKLKSQIEALETQYKSFSVYKLDDVCEMKTCRTGGALIQNKNALYVPKIGNTTCIEDLSTASLKHQNYLELIFDSNIVLAGYMRSFFCSLMGRQLLESLKYGYIPSLTLIALKVMVVPIPTLAEQRDIIATMEKLSRLKEGLKEFENELSLNPTSSVAVLEQLDNITEVLEGLTAADKIKALIRNGESRLLEFKETLSWNIRSEEKDVAIEISSLKTIVGFLNSDGGVLLIGVSDDGDIPGVNFEVNKLHKNNIDRFQTGFKNLLKDRIGEQFYPYFDVTIDIVDSKYVVRVECRPSSDPCFLINPKTKQEEFYVRAPAATDKLEGRKLVEYIGHHWSK